MEVIQSLPPRIIGRMMKYLAQNLGLCPGPVIEDVN